MDENVLKSMMESAENAASEGDQKMKFSPEEANRFKKAFEDPEFRKMFSEYMDELQDPKNREENEAYINQLESEKKVPEGKELIRPKPGFVVKTYKMQKEKKEKLFVNIVYSEKIAPPVKGSTGSTAAAPGYDAWSLPYSLGPPHMEKDKKGESVAAFDCCFHPSALALCGYPTPGTNLQQVIQIYGHKVHPVGFRNLLISTACEGIEESFRRQGQTDIALAGSTQTAGDGQGGTKTISSDAALGQVHIVKGLDYKAGSVIPTMLIAKEQADKQWSGAGQGAGSQGGQSKEQKQPSSSQPSSSSMPSPSSGKRYPAEGALATVGGNSSDEEEEEKGSSTTTAQTQAKKQPEQPQKTTAPAVVKAQHATVVKKNPIFMAPSPVAAVPAMAANKDNKAAAAEEPASNPSKVAAAADTAANKPVAAAAVTAPPPKAAIKKGFLNRASEKAAKIPTITASKQPASAPIVAATAAAVLLGKKEDKEDDKEVDAMAAALAAAALDDDSEDNEASKKAKAKSQKLMDVDEQIKAVSSQPRQRAQPAPLAAPPIADPTVAAVTGPVAPSYTLTYREKISLGDFNLQGATSDGSSANNKDRTHLIYTLHLPLIDSPVHCQLEVSSGRLVFSYRDLYRLTIDPLPATVQDTVGAAKYDKQRKTLTITLPIVQVAQQVAAAVSRMVKEEKEAEEVADVVSPDSKKQEDKATNAGTAGAGHQRWINTVPPSPASAAATAVVEQDKKEESITNSGNSSLLQEVLQQAEAAKAAYQLQQQQQQQLKQPPSSPATVKQPQPPQVQPLSNATFLAIASFQGAKKGYVYHRGDQGLGYYLDNQQGQAANSKADKAATVTATLTTASSSLFPYGLRQTASSLAILVQVPFILQESVQIIVGPEDGYTLQISFTALSADPAIAGTAADTAKAEQTRYAARFLFRPEHCTAGLVQGTATAAAAANQPAIAAISYDVAAKNMVIVLTKQSAGGTNIWTSTITAAIDEEKENNTEQQQNQQDHGWYQVESMMDGGSTSSQSSPVKSTGAATKATMPTSSSASSAATTGSSATAAALDQGKVEQMMHQLKFASDFISELD